MGKILAGLCEKHVKALGQNSRGLKSGNHLHFVKKTKMVSVLVESFFIDNFKDKAIGDVIAEQTAFGVAYAKAILEYFGIAYTPVSTPKYRVQVGAYSRKTNAETMKQKLRKAGFDAVIV